MQGVGMLLGDLAGIDPDQVPFGQFMRWLLVQLGWLLPVLVPVAGAIDRLSRGVLIDMAARV